MPPVIGYVAVTNSFDMAALTLLVGLRTRFDAVMIGAGTKRAEGYEKVSRRLIVVESGPDGRTDLPALLREITVGS